MPSGPAARSTAPRQAQRRRLVERPRHELHAPGEAGRSDAGRHGHGRQAGEVERRRRAHERVLHRLGSAAELVLVLVAALRRRRDGRRDERVEPLRLEGRRDRLLHEAPRPLGAQVDGRRKQQSRLEERPHLVLDRVGRMPEPLLVVRGRLRGDDRELRRERALELGDRELDDRRAVGLEDRDRGVERGADVGLEGRERLAAQDADAQAVDLVVRVEERVGERRAGERRRVLRVGAGEHREQQRRVLDRSRQRPHVVERPAERERAGAADATVRRLHAHQPAVRRRECGSSRRYRIPIAPITAPAATAAPSRRSSRPGLRSRSHGLRVGGV